jgi:hypothetical protein
VAGESAPNAGYQTGQDPEGKRLARALGKFMGDLKMKDKLFI